MNAFRQNACGLVCAAHVSSAAVPMWMKTHTRRMLCAKRSFRIFTGKLSKQAFVIMEHSLRNLGSLEDGQSSLGCRLILDLFLLEWARIRHLRRRALPMMSILEIKPLEPNRKELNQDRTESQYELHSEPQIAVLGLIPGWDTELGDVWERQAAAPDPAPIPDCSRPGSTLTKKIERRRTNQTSTNRTA